MSNQINPETTIDETVEIVKEPILDRIKRIAKKAAVPAALAVGGIVTIAVASLNSRVGALEDSTITLEALEASLSDDSDIIDAEVIEDSEA